MVSELKFTKKQIKEFLGGLMSLNCTNGVCILYILFLWTCIFQDFYRILQVIASTNLREMKKILLNCLLLVALVGLFPRLAAQNITFKHLSTDNGLSQISVNDIYVDENNLIWIGTREGLNCYDGNDITIYRLEKNNPYSLFSNHLLRITGDGEGHLYLLCMEGVASFDMDTRRFATLLSGKVDAITYHEGLYIACGNEVFRYNKESGNFDSFFRLPSDNGNISSLFFDSSKRLWIGTEHDGLYRWAEGVQPVHLVNGQHVSSIFEDSSHNVWVGTWSGGIFLFDNKGTVRNIRALLSGKSSLSSDFVRCFEEDNKGCLWIGTEAGLDCLDTRTGRVEHYSEGVDSYGLTHSSVWCLQKDDQGTIWAGTYFGGVNYFNPEYAIYRFFQKEDNPTEGLSSPIVGNMLEDKRGHIWICTEGGGLNRFDPEKGTFQWFVHRPAANSISHNNVKSIWYDDAEDCIWLGLHLGGINKLDIKTGQFTVYRKREGDKETIPSDIVRDIVPYKDSLVVATQAGVCLFSRTTGKCRQLFLNHKEGKLIRMVADLEFDRNGVLWMAVTGEGVFSYNLKTDELLHYVYRNGESGISNNNVNSIFCDSENKLWFATSGSGLDCLDQKTNTFRNYDMASNGLPGDCVYKVCEGERGELLMITNQGFSCFDYRKGVIRNYLSENGFPMYSLNENALFMSKKKEVFLGGTSGMVMFALDMAMKLHRQSVPVLGTSPLSIDRAENRHKFSAMLDQLGIDQPAWKELTSLEDMEEFVNKVGYPVLVRPSYVLSGAAMNVCYNEDELKEFLQMAKEVSKEYPVVVSQFMQDTKEIEFDAVAQNGEVVEYAISEHIEYAGVHSGDATLVFPAQKIYFERARRIKKIGRRIAKELNISGPFNMQFLAKNNEVKVIECNLRASRSFPFVSKVLKRNFIETATRIMLGAPYSQPDKSAFDIDWIGVKASQFSFSRLHKADPVLGVDMSSTGEVGCIGDDFHEALLNSMIAVGFKIPTKSVMFSSGATKSKVDLLEASRMLAEKGYEIYATAGTATFLNAHGVNTTPVYWPDEKPDAENNVMKMIAEHKFDLIVNIPKNHTKRELTNGYKIRRGAIDHNIPLITNARLASAFIEAFCEMSEKDIQIKSWQDYK